jgi:hypothetical protein
MFFVNSLLPVESQILEDSILSIAGEKDESRKDSLEGRLVAIIKEITDEGGLGRFVEWSIKTGDRADHIILIFVVCPDLVCQVSGDINPIIETLYLDSLSWSPIWNSGCWRAGLPSRHFELRRNPPHQLRRLLQSHDLPSYPRNVYIASVFFATGIPFAADNDSIKSFHLAQV